MHSPPIELLVRAPGQQKTAPSEPETDGRFSDLLRPEPEPAVEPTEAAAGSDAAEQAVPEGAETGAEVAPVQTDAAQDGADIAVIPAKATTIVQPVTALPDAITHVAASGPTGSPAPSLVEPGTGGTPTVPTAPTLPNPSTPDGLPQAAGAQAAAKPVMPAPQPQQSGQPTAAALAEAPATPSPAPGATANTVPAADPIVAAATRMEAPAAGEATRTAAPPLPGEIRPTVAAQTAATVTPNGQAAAAGAGVQTDATTIVSSDPTARAPAPKTADAMPNAELANGLEATDEAELPVLPAGPDRTSKQAGQAAAAPNHGTSLTAKAGDPTAVTQNRAATPVEPKAVEPLPQSAQPEPAGMAGPSHAARPTAESSLIVAQSQASAPPPPAADQVVLQLRRAVAAGVDRLTVQLKPATLGRVDVQMEVGFDGRVQAVISAERPETLQLLQRDARTLTTALMDAGLQADSGSLSFNLRGQTGDQAGGGDHHTSDGVRPAQDGMPEDHDDATTTLTLNLGSGRVDMRV